MSNKKTVELTRVGINLLKEIKQYNAILSDSDEVIN